MAAPPGRPQRSVLAGGAAGRPGPQELEVDQRQDGDRLILEPARRQRGLRQVQRDLESFLGKNIVHDC